MTNYPIRVLLVGATGVFGRRLAEGLAAEPGVKLVLAGRTKRRLKALRRALPGWSRLCLLDRDLATAALLRETGADLVIDAAGPFQGSGSVLVEAAIDARIHYIDLADGRDFVANIRHYGAAAQRAGVAVISGASSTPALSHAVLDRMTRGWRRIDSIRVAISPGGRAPRGKSVVRAILSWAGRPVRVFREGGWVREPGWGSARELDFPGVGRRLVSLCETPDLDLLAERYQPRIAAEFLAGVESRLLHRALILAGMAVRLRWLRSLDPLAGAARLIAAMMALFSSNRGGMLVESWGCDGAGAPILARWSLAARGNGPHVPTLAALALVRRIRDGDMVFRGAGPCTGILTLEDFRRDFERLGIATGFEIRHPPAPVFEQALGADFEKLPPVTRAIHRPNPALLLEGSADVDGAETWVGRLLARLMGFPETARGTPLRVVIETNPDGSENWARVYPDRTMRSVMAGPDPATGTVEERFGRLSIRLRLDVGEASLTLTPVSGRWRRMPVPLWLLPRIAATERADGARHLFDVAITMPLFGRLVHYRGWLAILRDEVTASEQQAAVSS